MRGRAGKRRGLRSCQAQVIELCHGGADPAAREISVRGAAGTAGALRALLSKAPLSEEDPTEFLFHVRGVGGVGKSTLLRQWQEAARRADAVTAVVDENDVKGYSRPRGTTASAWAPYLPWPAPVPLQTGRRGPCRVRPPAHVRHSQRTDLGSPRRSPNLTPPTRGLLDLAGQAHCQAGSYEQALADRGCRRGSSRPGTSAGPGPFGPLEKLEGGVRAAAPVKSRRGRHPMPGCCRASCFVPG